MSDNSEYWQVILECLDDDGSTYQFEYSCPVNTIAETPRQAIDCALELAGRSGDVAIGIERARKVAEYTKSAEVDNDRSGGVDGK